jgi:hypothetical protein
VFGFVAAKADVAVLLRRGPSKWVLMIRWNLATDEFEIGQWLHARVYQDQSDLSSDSKLFAYQALDGKWQSAAGGVYTAISRPPYFTALALWAGTAYEGGFRWSRTWSWWSFLQLRPSNPTLGTLPRRYAAFLSEADEEISALDNGWSQTGFGSLLIFERLCFAGELQRRRSRFPLTDRYALNGKPLDADWADVDHRGRLLFAREGRVFVRDADGDRELIDLNPLEFRPLAPPQWATEWPE